WFFDEMLVTNANQLLVGTTNSTATTNFLFNPPGAGDYILQARALIFTEFPLAWGPAKEVSALFLGPFSVQPQPQTVPCGTKVTFSAQASGSSPLTYQWQFNGNPLSDATGSSLG